MNMRLVVFGPPRSGTTYVAEWLASYLHHFYDYESYPLYEYFAVRPQLHDIFESVNGRLIKTAWRTVKRNPVPVDLATRLEWLKATRHHYLLKHMVHDHDPLIWNYLQENYHFVGIERRDLWRQSVSYNVARQTQEWYSSHGACAVQYKEQHLATLLASIGECRTRLAEVPAKTWIEYEEFCRNPYALIERLGLVVKSGFEPNVRIRPMEHGHEQSIVNLDEARAIFARLACEQNEGLR